MDRRRRRLILPSCGCWFARASVKAKLLQSGEASLTETSRSEGISRSYLTRLARLAFLAPDIVCAILDGRQPAQLTAARLIAHHPVATGLVRATQDAWIRLTKTSLWRSRCRAIARSPRRFTASSLKLDKISNVWPAVHSKARMETRGPNSQD